MTSRPEPAADFRCSAASARDAEPLAGTAPTETRWLFVELAAPWGRKALAEARLPGDVVAHLQAWEAEPGHRVQLVRRHGGRTDGGTQVFAATLGGALGAGPATVTGTVLEDVSDLLSLDLDDLPPYAGPLWFVCTNGRRDLCCAEIGRPVTAALAERWPDATWETTHLGGHRFAGTLLALPSGVTLGRLDAESAVAACAGLEAGAVALEVSRGVAGHPGAVQAADLHLRRTLGLAGLDEVSLVAADDTTVTLGAGGSTYALEVAATPVPPRRQSCADLATKPGVAWSVGAPVRL